MDHKCFVCGRMDAQLDPDDEGHYACSLQVDVGEDGACNVDIYPHLYFNNINLCSDCKAETVERIIREIVDRITRQPRHDDRLEENEE